MKETRPVDGDQTMRRYWCIAGHKWKTLEVLDVVYTDDGIHANRIENCRKMRAAKKGAYAVKP